MKKKRGIFGVLLFLSLLGGSHSAQAGILDHALASRLGSLAAGEKIAVIVQMAAQTDLSAATASIPEENRAGRGRAVIKALKNRVAATQDALIAFLQGERAAGRVESFAGFWVFNGFAVKATAEVVAAIADRPDVAWVGEDWVSQLPPPLPGQQEAAINASEWNIDRISVPKVWLEFNNRGEGAVAGVIDSGFDPAHPDLASRWRGGANSWLDAVNGNATPYDDHGHGSHTTGTAVGGDAGGTDIGVAPSAQFIACKSMNAKGRGTSQQFLSCMEFMLDPDGNPDTADFPDVVNNSWGTNPGCFRVFQSAVKAWVAAGIFPSFSAGNAGPESMTGGSPAVYKKSFAVGATDINDTIAGFSSRGPSSCDNTTFPEVSAPGVSVRSAWPGGGYKSLSGTSMAAPHVTGCVLLMRSAQPGISIKQLTKFLKKTAKDLGADGPDNDYGWGRINCFDAVKTARQ